MNSDMKFGEVPGGTKFVRAESTSSSRRLFLKIDMTTLKPSSWNAVDISTGELRCFPDDLEVITVL